MENVQETTVITGPSKDERTFAMLLHLSQFLGYIIPFAGFIAPLVMWLIKKDESAYIDAHGKVVFNWIISAFIWGIIGVILVFVGIGILILIALGICHIVFAIIGAIRANDGIIQNYPLTIKFFRV
ncbi:DUF4870 domain-containing protein [Pseudidiomarina sp. CB1]|uniref:DUF4870 domain-containing protein n=1 Tax=Pseudidiomarina sp. CB1 TaxID=2972484 RepID=UPI0021635EA3|nr:DUF4870 domain-containing protein [Pseudidiomarina sp. CB1]